MREIEKVIVFFKFKKYAQCLNENLEKSECNNNEKKF